jgi:RNA polymerase sigma-70 factor (ECF subfamily)
LSLPVADAAALLALARAAWPEIALDEAVFMAWIAARAGGDGDGGELHAADLYLACACARGDAAALAAFERRYLAEVPRFLIGTRSRPDIVEEVKQRLRVRLFTGERPRIEDYSGHGSLECWLRVAAVRTASNLRRDERASGILEERSDEPRVDLERAHLQARYGGHFQSALAHALARLEVRERTLLKLHFVERVSFERLAVMFQVHRATVVRWVAAARRRAFAETLAYLRDKLPASDAELDSLLRIVRSQLEISLRQLFT